MISVMLKVVTLPTSMLYLLTIISPGCRYIDQHNIKPPSGFKNAYIQYCAGGWHGLNFPIQFGGQGLPNSMGLFQSEVMGAACQAWSSYPGLSRGAIRTLITHASDEVKDIFVPRMVSGEWTGTMCLTEPHCGSDLNQVCRPSSLYLQASVLS